jgi:hypothetical protein
MAKSKKRRFLRNYFEKTYENNILSLNKQNLKKISSEKFKNPLPKNLDEKITNFVDKFKFNTEFTYKNVVSLLKNSILFSAKFTVEPGRQNVYEKTAYKFLKEILGEELSQQVSKLPSSGNQSCYVVDGVLRQNVPKNQRQGQKSIDFKITLEDLTIYIAHKYTYEKGGAQDNQYKDLLGFLFHANRNREKSILYVAIADGPYYKGSKMISLKETANGEHGVYATDMSGFYKIIKPFLKT